MWSQNSPAAFSSPSLCVDRPVTSTRFPSEVKLVDRTWPISVNLVTFLHSSSEGEPGRDRRSAKVCPGSASPRLFLNARRKVTRFTDIG